MVPETGVADFAMQNPAVSRQLGKIIKIIFHSLPSTFDPARINAYHILNCSRALL